MNNQNDILGFSILYSIVNTIRSLKDQRRYTQETLPKY